MSSTSKKQSMIEYARENFSDFAEVIEAVLPDFVRLEWYQDVPYKPWFKTWQKAGITILPNHYYSPIPDLNELTDHQINKEMPLIGIEMADNDQLELLKQLSTFKHEYAEFADRTKARKDGKYFLGGAYPRVDAEIAYAMVRHLKPSKIIEIGAGFSSLAMSEACLANRAEGHETEFVSIDPYPNPIIQLNPPGLTQFLETPLEEVDPTLFDGLGKNDILFIDSTHVIKPGNDVDFEYFSLIPNLPVGVVVHVHDIFLPKPYPSNWLRREHIYWNEQYLLAAFLAFNEAFKTKFASAYICQKYPSDIHEAIPKLPDNPSAGSFWFERLK